MSLELEIISNALGWSYFIVWSVSFYPQIYEWYKLENAEGLSINYTYASAFGFLLYGMYTIAGSIYSGIGTNVVAIQDVFFAIHALVMVSVLVMQMHIYPNGNQRIHIINQIIFSSMFIPMIILFVLNLCGFFFYQNLNFILLLAYYKATLTILKYIPQIYRNWARQSTVGWSIYEVLLDISGGLLSYLQLMVDTIHAKRIGTYGTNGNQINVGKLMLSFIAVWFNVIFIYQHYCLYYDKQYQKKGNKIELKKFISTESAGRMSPKTDGESTHASSLRFGKQLSVS